MATKRLNKELKDLETSSVSGLLAMPSPIESHPDLFHWVARLIGPPDTPYEDGVFSLDIKIPKDYPFKPPDIRFTTKIYHPNIDALGRQCLDIVCDMWSPALTIVKCLNSIASLLADPNPDDPLCVDIAKLYKENREEFNRIATEWTNKYAC